MIESAKIKVLVVDDSAIVRKVLTDALCCEPDIEVVGTAPDPFVARDKILLLRPDVLTLDIEMPRMDGVSFLKRLMHYHPLPVIVISSLDPASSRAALEALEAGAIDVLAKPPGSQAVAELRLRLPSKIRAAAGARLNCTSELLLRRDSLSPQSSRQFPTLAVIAIGASTGGTEAILKHHAGCFILSYRAGAGFFHGQYPLDPIGAHAGENSRGRIASSGYGDRVEQDVDSGALKTHEGPVIHFILIAALDAPEHHVAVAGCDERQAWLEFLAAFRLANPGGTTLVEAICEGPGEYRRHVLNDEHSRTLLREPGKDIGMPREAIRCGAIDRIVPLPTIADVLLTESRRQER